MDYKKTLKGYQRVGKRKKNGGWELTVQDLQQGWKKPVNSSLSFGPGGGGGYLG